MAGCCFKCDQHLFNTWVCITYHMGTMFDKGRDTIALWKAVILSMTLVVGYCPYKQTRTVPSAEKPELGKGPTFNPAVSQI